MIRLVRLNLMQNVRPNMCIKNSCKSAGGSLLNVSNGVVVYKALYLNTHLGPTVLHSHKLVMWERMPMSVFIDYLLLAIGM